MAINRSRLMTENWHAVNFVMSYDCLIILCTNDIFANIEWCSKWKIRLKIAFCPLYKHANKQIFRHTNSFRGRYSVTQCCSYAFDTVYDSHDSTSEAPHMYMLAHLSSFPPLIFEGVPKFTHTEPRVSAWWFLRGSVEQNTSHIVFYHCNRAFISTKSIGRGWCKIAILHQPRQTDPADMNKRLQTSYTRSKPLIVFS